MEFFSLSEFPLLFLKQTSDLHLFFQIPLIFGSALCDIPRKHTEIDTNHQYCGQGVKQRESKKGQDNTHQRAYHQKLVQPVISVSSQHKAPELFSHIPSPSAAKAASAIKTLQHTACDVISYGIYPVLIINQPGSKYNKINIKKW